MNCSLVPPDFAPRIYTQPHQGDFYEDGQVLGAVDQFVTDAGKGLVIHEWSSTTHGARHTTRALQWLRCQGFTHIVANSVGLIEHGVGDIATAYWMHMHSKGLVDVLLDDDGADITPRPT